MIRKSGYFIPVLLSALLLSACKDSSNNSSSDEHQTDGFDVNEAGRLVVTSADSAELSVLNAKDGSLVERFDLDNPASALYASPQYRFAMVAQREQNQVQILDGGLYQEDHGDHLHPYEKDPAMMAQPLAGVRPTHYRDHESRSAFFFDGNSEGALMASVADFDDDEILSNEVRTVELNNFMHGTAEPRGEFLLITYREENAASMLPDQVELHQFNSASGMYEFVERFEEECPALHGSFSTEEASVFGCSDGVLLVTQDGDDFAAEKIANPDGMADGARIGGFSGHPDGHVLAGWARGALYAVDLDEKTMTAVDWTGGNDATYSTSKMDDEGEILMVLDDAGALYLLDAENNFARLAVVQALAEMPDLEGHASVSITPSKSSENVYIADAVNQQLVVVNVEHQEVEAPIDLAFTPAHVAWVGIAGGHDHGDEGHGEEGHDHDD